MSNTIAPFALSTIRNNNGLFSLNDLHTAAGGADKHRPTFFLRNEQTQDLIAEIDKEINNCANMHNNPKLGILKAVETKRGIDGGTYACKQIVCAYAMWISPAFYLSVINHFLSSHAPSEYRHSITAEQQRAIQEAVNAKARAEGLSHHSIYHDLKTRYQIAKYDQLLQTQFADCLNWLGNTAAHSDNLEAQRTHAIELMERGLLAYREQSKALEKLSDQAADLCYALRQIEAQAQEIRANLIEANRSGAVFDGLREAQFKLKFPLHILRAGRQAAQQS